MLPKNHNRSGAAGISRNSSKGRAIVSAIISLLLIASSILIIFYRQRIIDQITVWRFQPTTEATALADRDGMINEGRFLYYASQSELDSSSDFNKVCTRIEKTSSILGCYNNSRIYIYNITDARLDGIREVTAAHEMLHAAYQRMSDSEKTTINALLETEYKKLENDKDFADLIAYYSRTEPGERDNELHSVIGTEIANIDPALETHYGQYFSNRQNVVALYAKYNSVFQDLKDKADALAVQLSALAASIPDRSANYNADVQTLNADVTAFNKRASSGGFLTQAQFNSERSALMVRAADIDLVRTSINDDVSKYNSILDEYNSIATESNKLYNSMDSTLNPVPSV